jgi:hypothetical protein
MKRELKKKKVIQKVKKPADDSKDPCVNSGIANNH